METDKIYRNRENGRDNFLIRYRQFRAILFVCLCVSTVFLSSFETRAQAQKRTNPNPKPSAKKVLPKPAPIESNLPKVTQINALELGNLLKREGENAKPLLVNFWATWCEPCREEFPDLVKINADYQEKIDFITVSLDELSEIGRDVPKFLAEMKATMPAYLLKTPDEEAAIASVSKTWQGGLPFTILFGAKGETVYSRQGKVKLEVLRPEIEKIANISNLSQPVAAQTLDLGNLQKSLYTFEKGKADAQKDIALGKLIIKRYGFAPGVAPQTLKDLKEKFGVRFVEHGCLVPAGFGEYASGYNETMKAEIKRKFGDKALETLAQN